MKMAPRDGRGRGGRYVLSAAQRNIEEYMVTKHDYTPFVWRLSRFVTERIYRIYFSGAKSWLATLYPRTLGTMKRQKIDVGEG